MKYLTSYGGLWKLSDVAYKRLLKTAAAGKVWNLDHYGRQIASEVINVTDMDDSEAATRLSDLTTNLTKG